jgi:nucleoside-diphosphate-sugar epimerase
MDCLLVTGITGNVGIELCRYLATARRGEHVRLLIRARDPEELASRWARALATATGGTVTPADVPGFVPVCGDVSRPELGLARADLEAVRAETTHILHSASLTQFAAPPALLRAANVDGLCHVLDVARGCRGLRAFSHLSTCFTAGRRQGRVLEAELEHGEGFVNGYEASKYEAERIARRAMAELPLSVYRLSLLIGRRDGYVHRAGAFHYFLEKLHAGLLPLIPGHAEARFDILPTDYAVEVLATLCFERFEPGRTYHIAAGGDAPTTLEWLRMTTDLYRAATPAWRKGAHVAPDIVDIATYRHLVETVLTVGNKTMARMLKVIDSLAEYPLSMKVFDRGAVIAALGDRLPVPRLESYYPSLIEAGLRGGWWSGAAG